MLLLLESDWNVIFTIGLLIAIIGPLTLIGVIVYCLAKMEIELKDQDLKIPTVHFFRPFAIYVTYYRIQSSKRSGTQKEQMTRRINLVKYCLVLIPTIFMVGMLIMVIGKSL